MGLADNARVSFIRLFHIDNLNLKFRDKTSKNYYPQSSKDNRGTNRFRNKYENSEMSQRYNNYHRGLSAIYFLI